MPANSMIAGTCMKKIARPKKDKQTGQIKAGEFYFSLVVDVGGWEEMVDVEQEHYEAAQVNGPVQIVTTKVLRVFGGKPFFQNQVTKFAQKAA